MSTGRFALAAMANASTLLAQTSPERGDVRPLDLPVNAGTRLVVVAPHPDDETLGAAGLMNRVIRAGGSVHVVWLTSGDGFPEGVEVAEGIAHPRTSDYF